LEISILNGLGFVSRPLYLFPQFFKDKAIEYLLGSGIKAEDLNLKCGMWVIATAKMIYSTFL
jgi:hypothetical protein